jgi:alpha-amylase
MTAICLTFQVHKPLTLNHYDFFQIGHQQAYFELNSNDIDNFFRDTCIPVNQLLQKLVNNSKGKFKFAFSLSGTLLDQQTPQALDSFRQLIARNSVELVCQTYYHSQCFLYSKTEFCRQVEKHRNLLQTLFNKTPEVFYNTEKFYGNDIARAVEELGFPGIICEGNDSLMMGRSPNHVYLPLGSRKIRALILNQGLMEDISGRFTDPTWSEYPLTPSKMTKWLLHLADKGDSVVNLVLNYDIFSQTPPLLSFLEKLVSEILSHQQLAFKLPTEIVQVGPVKGTFDATNSANWAESEKELPAGIENYLQRESLERMYWLEKPIKTSSNQQLLEEWSNLQSVDHFKLMANDNKRKYDYYINYMNILTDLEQRLSC